MKRGSLIFGILLLAVLWLGPLPAMAGESFAAHMLMHMGVVAVASAFLAIGLASTPLDLAKFAPRLVSPIPASLVELVIVWTWHAPAAHHFARTTTSGLVLEQGLFLFSGFLVWISVLGGERPRSRDRTAAGVIGLLMTSMHMTLLGALLALAPRPLFAHHHAGISAIDDQHLGGAIMLLIGGIAYLLGGLWLTSQLLRSQTREVGVAS